MISPDEIAADRAVIDAATGGDWQVLVGASWAGEVVVATSDGHPIAVVSTAPADPGAIADATAIAAARTGWPRALDALEAAWAEVERLRDERDAVSLTAERMTSYARKAEAAIARVRARHVKALGTDACEECSSWSLYRKVVPWPCATIRALDRVAPMRAWGIDPGEAE